MDAKIKAEWLEALRSGKYQQGKGCLRSASDNYCCLGVLAEVAGCIWDQGSPEQTYRARYNGTMDTGVLPGALGRELFGERDGSIVDPIVEVISKDDGEERHFPLSVLNDDDYTFAELADIIEEQL